MSKTNCSLSIIVPVYNAEVTLSICIDSILSQSYEDFELILVDDGSTDNSPVLCDEYAQRDSRVKVFHIENSGIFQARKYGAKKASGKILTFSDADDWLEKDAFETAMQLFCRNDPDILAYAYACGEEKVEKHLYKEGLYCKEEIRNQIVPGMMYDSACGGRRLNPSLCCKLIRKKLYTKVAEPVDDRITLGEDALVTYPAVCLAESIFICNKPLYHYSVNPSSCTHNYPLERIAEIRAFQHHMTCIFDELGMLVPMSYQIENYVRSFLVVMVRNWFGIELSPVLFGFPYEIIPKGAKLLIYGAGNVGKSYVNELKHTCYARIAGWADKDYDHIKEYHGESVISPEQIKEKEFDILLIAVRDEKRAKMIEKDLLGLGISEKKITWIEPRRFL